MGTEAEPDHRSGVYIPGIGALLLVLANVGAMNGEQLFVCPHKSDPVKKMPSHKERLWVILVLSTK